MGETSMRPRSSAQANKRRRAAKARRGTRPSAPYDQRTASTYIFGAICPSEGKGAALVLPACNTEAMNLHLAEIATEVALGAHAVLLIDRAGWHLASRLVVPPNITLVALPPKCPELNPVENVWQFMRDNWLSNRIFTSYHDLLDHCCDAGTSSPISRGPSCPSASVIGHTGPDQRAPVLLGGRADFMITTLPSVIGLIDGSQMRPLAVTTKARTKKFPDVPTISESGWAAYEATAWYGFVVPKGTPKEIVAKLREATIETITKGVVRERLEAEGAEPIGNTPEEFAAMMKAKSARWADVVKQANIKVD